MRIASPAPPRCTSCVTGKHRHHSPETGRCTITLADVVADGGELFTIPKHLCRCKELIHP